MTIFRLAEVFGQLRGDMAKARKTKADDNKVSAWVGRLVAAGADRAVFETLLAELEDDSALTSADLIAIAHTYNKGGKKPGSKSAALAMIKKRFVEIVRFHAKNKVAEKVRPW
jgi:uncharacterized Ntn-hydrolase superfamily protein